jgi:transcriptional regulator with XRE-family HTH domain
MSTMKLNYSKEWYEQRIGLEGESEVGAGCLPASPESAEKEKVTFVDTRIALGTFVSLWRRNQGWDAARLAEKAGLAPQEILEIERDPHCEPEPDTVYKLAQVFGLPAKPLLELAGLIQPRTSALREEAVRFAARSEPVTSLDEHEREAFEAFVSAISHSVAQKK